ncbi:hypothetical protein I3J09_15680 [Streptomyces clavuligerus]|uniref:hypothetical protein n=1 Tax=Streptomyces clavuligerus TaxID=1901 RepID=UPI00020D92AB|nr:hypothetical protein [Streptomyces clavuligerus]ANW19521.1 hypothetical protein BB341_15495 [Streptomyces clavuligerus]AXU14128.1 hypothetical protein D1794_16155 [Streptomyces clavuligerus]MBY6304118.1 hypothetical protein [Streptomyces clavuligerus]QPJ93742.1 hypothetical protein GE265_12530 [Streptomyces clavuligerus]QPL64161.1 hypothetical protein I3J04_15665 [Streptomyces clavuligerus]
MNRHDRPAAPRRATPLPGPLRPSSAAPVASGARRAPRPSAAARRGRGFRIPADGASAAVRGLRAGQVRAALRPSPAPGA